jgi:hypothetical protein
MSLGKDVVKEIVAKLDEASVKLREALKIVKERLKYDEKMSTVYYDIKYLLEDIDFVKEELGEISAEAVEEEEEEEEEEIF